MDIAKCKHLGEALFAFRFETTALGGMIGIV